MPETHPPDPPGAAQHVIQRVSTCASLRPVGIDHARYLRDLREIARREGCRVHAYALMADRIHLLLTPGSAGGMVRTLQALEHSGGPSSGAGGDPAITASRARWLRARPVRAGQEVLRCQRDIELQPVRAGIVIDPISYRWSSHRHHVLGLSDRWLAPHRALLALGRNPRERRERYRRLVMEAACAQHAQARNPRTCGAQRGPPNLSVPPRWTSSTA